MGSLLSEAVDTVETQCSKNPVSIALPASSPPTVAPEAARFPERAGERARRLAEGLAVTETLGAWLDRRGFSDIEETRRFLNPRLSELTRPDGMADREAAADRIARAIRARERIAIFGDYDCDGMTAAAILTEMLRALDGDVRVLLGSRFDGGYGVSERAVARIVETGASLLVTCDCGSSDHENLSRLRARGLDVIVVDHHLVPDEPLPALAFLNPHRKDCGFGYKGLASCGLVLSVGAAVRSALGRELDLRRWLDLVAIGTIADVAPLDRDNRALVRAGLGVLRAARRPGIRALLEQARLDGAHPFGTEDVSFRIAPRLNAPGRLGGPEPALELLMATGPEAARALAAALEQASTERKAQQERILSEALEEIRRERYDERPAIVLGQPDWNPGIVGIVAGRLASRFERPVVVVGFDKGVGRGSVRGPAGYRLHDALARCRDTLVRFGGHQAAAGLEVEAARLSDLRAAFEVAVPACLEGPGSEPASGNEARVWLEASDTPARVLADLALLEPCGPENPAPEVVVEGALVAARAVSGGHLKVELELGSGSRLAGFGVEMGDQAADLGERVTLVGRLRPDRYRGGDAVELRIEQVLDSGRAPASSSGHSPR